MNIFSAVCRAALCGCAIFFFNVHAQTFPSGPLHIIVANAPGVPNDSLARGLVDPLGKALGVPVVVENRVGAEGIIGTVACAPRETPSCR